MTIQKKPWNRSRKRDLDRKERAYTPANSPYRANRIYARKRKLKHRGFTVIPESRLHSMRKIKINL